MNITKISNLDAKPYQPVEINKKELQNTTDAQNHSQKNQKVETNWQKDILLSALDSLENKIHEADNSHPLDIKFNAPIETNEEALIELNMLTSDTFKEQAYKAQANIDAQDIMTLFVDTPELVTQ